MRAGEAYDGYNVSGLQQAELQPAELSAARHVLDAEAVHVLVSVRPNLNGVLAILATRQVDATSATTCLGVMLQGPAPVRWFCPGAGLPARRRSWGQFDFARDLGSADPRLEIYSGSELVETVPLDLRPGEQRILP